jgi:hypothetical protein
MRMQPRERTIWLTLDLLGLVVFVAYFAGGPGWLLPVGFAALIVGGAMTLLLTRRNRWR